MPENTNNPVSVIKESKVISITAGWAISFTVALVVATFSVAAIFFEFRQNGKEFHTFEMHIEEELAYINSRIDKITGRNAVAIDRLAAKHGE